MPPPAVDLMGDGPIVWGRPVALAGRASRRHSRHPRHRAPRLTGRKGWKHVRTQARGERRRADPRRPDGGVWLTSTRVATSGQPTEPSPAWEDDDPHRHRSDGPSGAHWSRRDRPSRPDLGAPTPAVEEYSTPCSARSPDDPGGRPGGAPDASGILPFANLRTVMAAEGDRAEQLARPGRPGQGDARRRVVEVAAPSAGRPSAVDRRAAAGEMTRAAGTIGSPSTTRPLVVSGGGVRRPARRHTFRRGTRQLKTTRRALGRSDLP